MGSFGRDTQGLILKGRKGKRTHAEVSDAEENVLRIRERRIRGLLIKTAPKLWLITSHSFGAVFL